MGVGPTSHFDAADPERRPAAALDPRRLPDPRLTPPSASTAACGASCGCSSRPARLPGGGHFRRPGALLARSSHENGNEMFFQPAGARRRPAGFPGRYSNGRPEGRGRGARDRALRAAGRRRPGPLMEGQAAPGAARHHRHAERHIRCRASIPGAWMDLPDAGQGAREAAADCKTEGGGLRRRLPPLPPGARPQRLLRAALERGRHDLRGRSPLRLRQQQAADHGLPEEPGRGLGALAGRRAALRLHARLRTAWPWWTPRPGRWWREIETGRPPPPARPPAGRPVPLGGRRTPASPRSTSASPAQGGRRHHRQGRPRPRLQRRQPLRLRHQRDGRHGLGDRRPAGSPSVRDVPVGARPVSIAWSTQAKAAYVRERRRRRDRGRRRRRARSRWRASPSARASADPLRARRPAGLRRPPRRRTPSTSWTPRATA